MTTFAKQYAPGFVNHANMNDAQQLRLQAVETYKDLDAGIVKDLNEIVDLAADICQTPVALVTLLDADTQWFKAAKGTALACTPREVSFCNYTIEQQEVFVIPDTLADERFRNNPLVSGEPYVRFYAGAPIVTKDGHTLGSLCIIDLKPRTLSEQQQRSLKTLAKQAVNLMELHRSLSDLEQQHSREQAITRAHQESEMKLKAIFDSSNDTHILVDKALDVVAFNRSAAIFARAHFHRRLTVGESILHYTEPHVLEQFKKYAAIALTGRSIKREWLLGAGGPHECWKVTSFIPVKDNKGKVIGVSLNSTDVTQRKMQEAHINVQNAALQRIAIVQSHELRRPVASLLGIMDLLKMDNINFSYFDMLETTVNELDEKIRCIVKDSEDTLNSGTLSVA